MAFRALSGILFTRGIPRGTVTIHFDPHRAEAPEPAGVGEMTAAGADGPFAGAPCKHVALRQISHVESTGPLSTTVAFVIDDKVDRDKLVIEWDTEGNAVTSEISYLVIGEVEDA